MTLTLTLSDSQAKALQVLNMTEDDAAAVAFSAFKSQLKSRISQMERKASESNGAIYEAAVRSGFQAPTTKQEFVKTQTETIQSILREL